MHYGNIGLRLCTAEEAANSTRLVPAATCEFSSDEAGEGFAIFSQRGSGVPFVSGLVTRVQTPPQLPHIWAGMGANNVTTAAGGSAGQQAR